MQENTNRAIALNSIIMYARMGINTVLALLTTRFALKALGVADFGLFSVLGSIISFMGVFNTIMLSTSNRFIAVAIGKGDEELINRTFNINVLIFISCAILLLIIGCPLGDWYVRNHINYDGPIENALINYFNSLQWLDDGQRTFLHFLCYRCSCSCYPFCGCFGISICL